MNQSKTSVKEPLTLPCGSIVKNRLLKSAMSENMADPHFTPTSSHENLYAAWARGGVGLCVSGNIMIDSGARGEPRNVVVEEGRGNIAALKAWAQKGTANGTHLWGQLNHPGKQIPKLMKLQTVAPSAIPFKGGMSKFFDTPRELSEKEILEIVQKFAYSAKTLKESGFTGVQIHGAHGYLVNQFLSPLHNQRKDRWGGTLTNRMRFVESVYKAIREAVGPAFPVGIKINSADFQRGGFTEEESLEVVQSLSEYGMDLIEISGGTYEAPVMMEGEQKKSTRAREAYFLDYVNKIRQHVKAPLALTGGFRTAEFIRETVASQKLDMVGLGRSLALDPTFAQKILSGQEEESAVRPLTTGFKKLDKIFPLEITWYTQQLQRIGKNKSTQKDASVCLSVLKSFYDYGTQSLRTPRGA